MNYCYRPDKAIANSDYILAGTNSFKVDNYIVLEINWLILYLNLWEKHVWINNITITITITISISLNNEK